MIQEAAYCQEKASELHDTAAFAGRSICAVAEKLPL
jgi:hypothetical protein